MDNIIELKDKARIIRKEILKMINRAGSGHPGGSLSCVDILVTLYFHTLNHKPVDPLWSERDIFILSKGHAAPALYATLAEAGYFTKDLLFSLRSMGSALQGHPDHNLPGVEISTGSLGQGLSIGNGVTLANKMNKKDTYVYVLLGDGECDEGQIWEAAMFSPHYHLDNLIVIIDRNGLQIDGPTEKIMRLEPLSNKWKSFGWHVIEIDGNNINAIIDAIKIAKKVKGQPNVIIAHTFKGKGVSFMEWINSFHGRAPNNEELIKALVELGEPYEITID